MAAPKDAMSVEKLTGRRRYYSQKIGGGQRVMALEVEVSYWDDSKRKWSVKWRDATFEDLSRQEQADVGC